MSLMGTLGKVAMGIVVAKAAGKMMGGGSSSGGGLGGLLGGLTGGSASQSGGGLGGLLGGLTGGQQQGGGAGGLGGLLGGLTGGQQQGGAGGLGGLLGGLTGGQQQGGAAGGLGGLLSGLAGGQQQGGAAGGLGGLLNQLGGGAQGQSAGTSSNFGDMFNSALNGEEPENVTADDEANAELLLRAMISAAKADGELDDDEKTRITEHLGDVSEEEANFVRQELQAPVDLQSLIASVPQGMEQQVYLMSLMGITLDNKQEAIYLDQLAQGLNISNEQSNQIHAQLGVPQLYT